MPTIVSLTSCIVDFNTGSTPSKTATLLEHKTSSLLQPEGLSCSVNVEGYQMVQCSSIVKMNTYQIALTNVSFVSFIHLYVHGMMKIRSRRYLPLNNFRSSTSSGPKRPSRMLSNPEVRNENKWNVLWSIKQKQTEHTHFELNIFVIFSPNQGLALNPAAAPQKLKWFTTQDTTSAQGSKLICYTEAKTFWKNLAFHTIVSYPRYTLACLCSSTSS